MPADLMTVLSARIDTVSFMLQWQQDVSQQSGGSPRVADIGEPLWMAKISCSAMNNAAYRAAEAAIDRLAGSLGTFYLWDKRAAYPSLDPKGATLGSDAVTILTLGGDNKTLTLAGLPVGYVLSPGDFMAFDTGSDPVRRCLHKIVVGGTADGSGHSGTLEVIQHIRPGAITGLTVTLIQPAAEMFIMPGSYDEHSSDALYNALSFTALQVP